MHTPHADIHHGSILSYTVGFILSIGLTLLAYFAVVYQLLSGFDLVILLAVLATAQLTVQLIFFLHLGKGPSKHWNVLAFIFMIIVVAIVVIGSIWIMNNLNYNMMPPQETDSYMIKEADKGF